MTKGSTTNAKTKRVCTAPERASGREGKEKGDRKREREKERVRGGKWRRKRKRRSGMEREENRTYPLCSVFCIYHGCCTSCVVRCHLSIFFICFPGTAHRILPITLSHSSTLPSDVEFSNELGMVREGLDK